ncbi:hypothetical protein [Methylobacterium sp. ID0610]|uniref:hypothetical protein n=1 Tax=Methylobacterium carpenticola TaxID=3344827 RepID=UPI0036A7C403
MTTSKARLPSIDEAECPVPLATLGELYRGDGETIDTIVSGIPARTRARLAAYLYGKSHTHEIGLRVAATCAETDLVAAAGLVGTVLFTQSRARPVRAAEPRVPATRRISLAGSAAARAG